MRPEGDEECEDRENMLNDEELVVPIHCMDQPARSDRSKSRAKHTNCGSLQNSKILSNSVRRAQRYHSPYDHSC